MDTVIWLAPWSRSFKSLKFNDNLVNIHRESSAYLCPCCGVMSVFSVLNLVLDTTLSVSSLAPWEVCHGPCQRFLEG